MHNHHFKIAVVFFFSCITFAHSQAIDTTQVPAGLFRMFKFTRFGDYKEFKWHINEDVKRRRLYRYCAVYIDNDDSLYPDEIVYQFDSTGIYEKYFTGPDESKIPQKAKDQISLILPDSAKAFYDYTWDYIENIEDKELPGAHYGAEIYDTVRHIAEFDSVGNYVGMETQFFEDSTKLPEKIIHHIRSDYKGCSIEDIRKYTDAANKFLYTRVEIIPDKKRSFLCTCLYFNEKGKECKKPLKFNSNNITPEPTW